MTAESSRGPVDSSNTSETAASLFQELINSLDVVIPEVPFSYCLHGFHISGW